MRLAFRSTPVKRRQMMVLVFHVIGLPLCLAFFFFCCAIPLAWPLLCLYAVFVLLDPRPEAGVRLSALQRLIRASWWWRMFAEYFPIRLHKTVDLAPCFQSETGGQHLIDSVPTLFKASLEVLLWWYYALTFRLPKSEVPTGQKYIFGYHPHGIIGMGAVGGVATEGAGWSKLFPGIPVRLLTLRSNFYLPFYREYVLGIGCCSVSRTSCMRLLKNGHPICIVLGGARESTLARPNNFDLVLENRKGFVKIALQTGASMVPILAFGETNLFNQVPTEGGGVAAFHRFMTKYLGFTIPLFHARGIFNYEKGIIPFRLPIDVVVGRPINVPQEPHPSRELVESYHQLYVKEVRALFQENRDKFWKGDDLRIVG